MKIQKFEAYKYRCKKLDVINRKDFLNEISSVFSSEMFGFQNTGTSYDPNEEIIKIYLHDYETGEELTIKMDLSDIGIEIGKMEWYNEEQMNDDDELGVFIPKRNLDNPITIAYKNQKKDVKKFNV